MSILFSIGGEQRKQHMLIIVKEKGMNHILSTATYQRNIYVKSTLKTCFFLDQSSKHILFLIGQ